MNRFTQKLLAWYDTHKRDLPWRDCGDPYRIWISEIILQQTRIAQGTSYYLRFIEQWPDVESLARAPEDEVMKAWEGLGYDSRARNLHFAARQVVEKGGFPKDYDGVKALKGIGEYTAAAICSMAYGLPYAAIDGNAYRVLGRVFAVEEPIDTIRGKRYYTQLAQQLMDASQPGKFNQAVMDFGAMQCVPQNPDCHSCPLSMLCAAHASGRVHAFPCKSKRLPIKERHFTYLYIIVANQAVLMHKRQDKDIWRGLCEPYLIERTHAGENGLDNDFIQTLVRSAHAKLQPLRSGVKHVLTHRIIHADFHLLHVESLEAIPDGYELIPVKAFSQLALPVLVRQNLPEALV